MQAADLAFDHGSDVEPADAEIAQLPIGQGCKPAMLAALMVQEKVAEPVEHGIGFQT